MTAERERQFWQERLRPDRFASDQSIRSTHEINCQEDMTGSLNRVLRHSTQEEDLPKLWRWHHGRWLVVYTESDNMTSGAISMVRFDQASECRCDAADDQPLGAWKKIRRCVGSFWVWSRPFNVGSMARVQ